MKIIKKEFNELCNEELYEILKLRGEVFVEEQKILYNDLDDRDKMAKHIYIDINNEIIGYARILNNEEYVSFGRVLVKKEYRGKGYCRVLLSDIISYIFEKYESKKIVISAQEYLREFYKSLGFIEISEVYLEVDIPHIKMELKGR